MLRFFLVRCLMLALTVVFSTSCATQSVPGVQILQQHNLGAELAETSGLWCDSQHLYTVNDSGNLAIIYQLDNSAKILKRMQLDVKNRDWEALSADAQAWYVADIGNNYAKRKQIQLYQVPRTEALSQIKTIELHYPESQQELVAYGHDRDAEALVVNGDALVMFSKSWLSEIAHVYVLNKKDSKQNLIASHHVEGLPGMVTGATYIEGTDHYVLVGYEGSGIFTPFIARLNPDFTLYDYYKLPSLGQVEAVCSQPDGKLWLTQESSFLSSAKLVNIEFVTPYQPRRK